MNKESFESGMLIKLRNGDNLVTLKIVNTLVFMGLSGILELNMYDLTLKHKTNSDYDIICVYEADLCGLNHINLITDEEKDILFEAI